MKDWIGPKLRGEKNYIKIIKYSRLVKNTFSYLKTVANKFACQKQRG